MSGASVVESISGTIAVQEEVKATITSQGEVSGDISQLKAISGIITLPEGYPIGEYYEGEYEFSPSSFNEIQVPTNMKLLKDDITINKIPFIEVTNQFGTTVYIGD